MRQIVLGAIVGAAVSLPLLLVCYMAVGGHGSYLPAILCFPYAMFFSTLVRSITVPLRVLALVQFPLYGALVAGYRGREGRRRIWIALLALHAGAVVATLVLDMRGGNFWP